MRICYIITKADEVGGAQVHVRDLAILAKEDGHDVLVIVGEDGLLVDQLIDAGITVQIVSCLQREISLKEDVKAVVDIVRLIKSFKPEVVALHSSKAGIIGRIASFFSGVPAVFTAHGWAFAEGISERRRKVYILIERLFSKLAAKIITVSAQDKELAIKHRVACSQKQVVIHNCIRDLSEDISFDNYESSNELKLIMVARFSEQKDHSTLFKALKKLKNTNWSIDLVGKGPKEEYYRNECRLLGLEDKVNFLGQRNDVELLLNASDIFLLISNWEGYPLSTLEAMRAGLPIIASDVGGVREAIDNKVNGFLVARKDVDGLASAIDQLLEGKGLRSEISQRNREDFVKYHTLEKMYSETISVYKSVV